MNTNKKPLHDEATLLAATGSSNCANKRFVESAISATAASKAAVLAREGLRYPLTLRTYCSAAS
jgi:hypothetical protein